VKNYVENVMGSIQSIKPVVTPDTRFKRTLVVLGLTLFALIGWFVKTEYIDRPTLVTVTGVGKVEALPEMVKFTIRIINNSSSPNIVVADNNRVTRDLISIVKKSGVGESDIIVSYVRVIPPTANLGLATYQAINAVDVTLRDISKFDNLVSTLYSIGASSLSNIVFTTEDSRELEKEAVTEAIKDAKSKAWDTARASRKRVGRMVSISTAQLGEAGALSGEPAKANFTGQISDSPSQIEIVRQAVVVFELRSLL